MTTDLIKRPEKKIEALVKTALSGVLGEDAAEKAMQEFCDCADCQRILRDFSSELRAALKAKDQS